MALGRGQVGAGEASAAVGRMRREFGTPRAAARRMAARAGLAEDLSDGVDDLARAGIDVAELVPRGRRRPALKRRRAAVGH